LPFVHWYSSGGFCLILYHNLRQRKWWLQTWQN